MLVREVIFMSKKLYFQKFEFKKSNYLLIIMLMFFFTFFLLVAIFGNGDKMFSLILCGITFLLLLYFIVYVIFSVKGNKIDIYDDHIEISVFKLGFFRCYNLRLSEIEKVEISDELGWSICFYLKNRKKIKFLGVYLPEGKGIFYEQKKFSNALKKVGL